MFGIFLVMTEYRVVTPGSKKQHHNLHQNVEKYSIYNLLILVKCIHTEIFLQAFF